MTMASLHTTGLLVLAPQKLCRHLCLRVLEATPCNSSCEESESNKSGCQHGTVRERGTVQQLCCLRKRHAEDLPATKALPLPCFALLANPGIVGRAGPCPAVKVRIALDWCLFKAILEIVIAEREGPRCVALIAPLGASALKLANLCNVALVKPIAIAVLR